LGKFTREKYYEGYDFARIIYEFIVALVVAAEGNNARAREKLS